jgi:hypothetical protein
MSRRVDPIRGRDATVSPFSTEASRQRGPPARVTPPIKRGNSDHSETDSRHVKKSIHGPQLADLSTFSSSTSPLQGPPKFENEDEFPTLWQVETTTDLPSAAPSFRATHSFEKETAR